MTRLRTQLPIFTLIRTVFNTLFRMVYPFLSVFARGLGVDLTTMSYALTARGLAGVFGPFAAAVADHRGRKFGMIFGVVLFTLGAALVVFWPTFPALVLSLCLTTIGNYVFGASLQAYLGDRTPYGERGRAIAVTEFGWSLAFIAGVPLMGFFIARSGWMAPFPLLTLLGVVIFAGLFLLLPNDEKPASDSPTLGANFRTVLTFAPALAGLCIGLFASTANEQVNLIFGVWLEQSFGLNITGLGLAAMVIGLSELCGEGLVATIVDRLGKPLSVAVGLCVNSVAALIIPILGRTEAGALAALFFFYISFEFTMVSCMSMMTEVLPGARATLMAFNVAFISLGRAIGAPLSTLLYHYGFSFATAGAVTFNLLALLALYRMQSSTARTRAVKRL
ncbi:MAG: MFS transporter [Anaerolineales bacterium]|jgi:predicted MFS family arabinose efflux permease